MDIVLWIITGGTLGWLAYALLGLNADRGRLVSILLGAGGAFAGGKFFAPMFLTNTTAAEGFGTPGIFLAAATAAVVLVLGNLVQNRWGV